MLTAWKIRGLPYWRQAIFLIPSKQPYRPTIVTVFIVCRIAIRFRVFEVEIACRKSVAHCCQDSFGLRQRLTVSFDEPLWQTMAEVEAACEKLPVQGHEPASFVSHLLMPILRWSLKPANATGCLFRASAVDGAKALIEDNFNKKMSLQQECFLVSGRHEESKHWGKLRTKSDRFILGLHHLDTVCALLAGKTAQPGFLMQHGWDLNQAWADSTSSVELPCRQRIMCV